MQDSNENSEHLMSQLLMFINKISYYLNGCADREWSRWSAEVITFAVDDFLSLQIIS